MSDITYYAHLSVENHLKGFYNDDVHELENIPRPRIEITEEQWQHALSTGANVYNPRTKQFEYQDLRTTQEREDDARGYRNMLLEELDKIVSNPLRWAELSEDNKAEYIEYRKKLLEVPQQKGFPEDIEWPVMPE